MIFQLDFQSIIPPSTASCGDQVVLAIAQGQLTPGERCPPPAPWRRMRAST